MPSKLDQLQQQFRQRLDQQKEEKLSSIRIYNENQQKVLDRVSNHRNPNNNNDGLLSRSSFATSPNELRNGGATASINFATPARKHGSGVDRSRPLKPMPTKPTVKGVSVRDHSSLATGAALKFGDSSSHSNMVLGNSRAVVRPPASSANSTTRPVRPSPNTTSTKVEVKKTGAGNKMIQTTTKPNEITKVTVETTKKNTPSNTVTTVKTTIHKRTIVPAKSVPTSPVKNGTSSAPISVRKTVSANGTAPVAAPKVNKTPVRPSMFGQTSSTTKALAKQPLAKTSKAPIVRSAPLDPNMAQCAICSRSFNNDRIDKHKAICQKTSVKKRKPFDVTKMRVKGTEAEEFVKKGVHKKEEPKPKKSNWRSQHETFIESIRQAKIVQKHLEAGGKLSDLPPPKPSENPDYVPCPHCLRKFNQAAAERHIPKCKNISSNKKPVGKK